MLTYKDTYLAPIYFILLLLWVIWWKNKYYKNSPVKKYIIPAFILKCICCFLLAFLFEYYYGYSDSANYFQGAKEIWSATIRNPFYGLELVFKSFENCSYEAQQFSPRLGESIYAASLKNMYKISGFIGMFCFGSYLPIALIMTLLSFMGSWKIYIIFVKEFPTYYKKIALTCLFAPSFIFWTTNIMKEPLCIFGLGLCVSALYNLMKGKFSFFILLEMFVGAYFLLTFKSYIFYIFCFAAFWSLYVSFATAVKKQYQILVKLLMFFILLALSSLAIAKRDFLGDIFSSNFVNDVTAIQTVQADSGGSTYTLPSLDDVSLFGVLRTYFNSLVVALFRPFVWEIPNIIAISNALESFAVLMITLFLLIKLKFTGFFILAFKNRILTFSIVFTLLLAPLAGLVSFNFGTLVRYKAPMVPFYYTFLLLLYYKIKEKNKIEKLSI